MYCTQCGTLAVAGGNYCANCGRPIAGSVVGAAAAAAASDSVYANFWLRVGAHMIDGAILTAVSYLGMILFMASAVGIGMNDSESFSDRFVPWGFGFLGFLVIWIAAPWLYKSLFESSTRQATPGKMACGIKVTNLAGERISFARASGRYFGTWISGLTFSVGYLLAACTEKRQALHDFIAGTVVVGAKATPASVAAAPPAQHVSGWVVAAIAALCSLFPLGILAAIAIPAYQDYTVRSQVSEGLMLAADYKAGVQEYVDQNGHWPDSEADLPGRKTLEAAIAASRHVESIEVWNGTVVIAYSLQANPRIRDHLVSLRPFVTAEGRIIWQCGNALVEEERELEAKPAGDGATDSDIGVTSVVDRYLPASCRSGHVQAN